jgi:hypothetical protein
MLKRHHLVEKFTASSLPASECALGSTREGQSICSTNSLAIKSIKAMVPKGACEDESLQCYVRQAKHVAGVSAESQLYQSQPFLQRLTSLDPGADISALLDETFNKEGPAFINNAISDRDIRVVMHQWKNAEYGRTFFPISFQLIDFASIPGNGLASFDWIGHLRSGYRSYAVVVNTASCEEIRQGHPGKHWFCMYFDFRLLSDDRKLWDKSTAADVRTTGACTLEYFNSSGRAPPKEVTNYFSSVKHQLQLAVPGINVWEINASLFQQQDSGEDCGVFCLFYIHQRLQGRSYLWFNRTRVTKEEMRLYRSRVWRHD